jgi:hypothetical protein
MSMGYADTRPAAPRMPRLGLRARLRAVHEARMVSPRSRRRLAEDLERAVVRAEQRHAPFTMAIPVSRDAAGDARSALLDLGERLRAPRPVDPDGVRLARELLLDGAGPLYVTCWRGDLRLAARRALMALDGRGGSD